MSTPYRNAADGTSADFDEIVNAAVDQAHAWIAETAEDDANDSQTQQLAALLRDDDGVRFTMDFVDRVMRPEDNRVAARALRSITDGIDPSFLGQINGLLVGLGAFVGPILPKVVIPAARARLRQLVGHLVLDAESDALNGLLDRAAERGEELNLNLLGEAVLGEGEATDRAERTLALIRNPRVTYVSVKASSMVAQLNPWDFEGSVERVKDRIRPLYRAARDRSPRVFLNMDMEEYHDLHLTIAVFTQLLAEEEFTDYEGGIVLQAYLPDTLAALEELAAFAQARVAAGGAKIKIRLVKGANLSMERAHAELHGWPQAPYLTKQDVDANYYRLLDTILRPEYADALSIGVATHNLFTAAFAKELAYRRGVSAMIDSEMLQGMSPAQQATVRGAYGRQILYTPVVHKEDFDVAVSYLVRRLEENAATPCSPPTSRTRHAASSSPRAISPQAQPPRARRPTPTADLPHFRPRSRSSATLWQPATRSRPDRTTPRIAPAKPPAPPRWRARTPADSLTSPTPTQHWTPTASGPSTT